MQLIDAHGYEVMYFVCFDFMGVLGFLNCDDVCMCVVNKWESGICVCVLVAVVWVVWGGGEWGLHHHGSGKVVGQRVHLVTSDVSNGTVLEECREFF